VLQKALAEHAPHGERQTPAIVTRNLRAPEAPGDELGVGVELAGVERHLVLGGVPHEPVERRPS